MLSADSVNVFSATDESEIKVETLSVNAFDIFVQYLNPSNYVLCGAGSVLSKFTSLEFTCIPHNEYTVFDALRHYVCHKLEKITVFSDINIRKVLMHASEYELFKLATSNDIELLVESIMHRGSLVLFSECGIAFNSNGFIVRLPPTGNEKLDAERLVSITSDLSGIKYESEFSFEKKFNHFKAIEHSVLSTLLNN